MDWTSIGEGVAVAVLAAFAVFRRRADKNGHAKTQDVLANGIAHSLERIEIKVDAVNTRIGDHIATHPRG